MKRTAILLFTFLTLVSCGASKEKSPSANSPVVESACPPKSECTFEILAGKSLDIKNNDAGTYFHLRDTPGKTVYRYTSKKITDPLIQDAGYSETILFETDGSLQNLDYSGTAIQKVQLLLNVQCFCRGKAGMYTVKEGTLAYADNKLHIEIPQLVDGQLTRVVDVSIR